MVLPAHLNLNLVRTLPDRPYSVLSSPTEANRPQEEKRGTIAYTLAKKNAKVLHQQQQQYQQQQSYFNSPNSSLRSNSNQDDFEQESLAEDVYSLNEARDLNERRNRYSHGRTGSMGSVKIITANHVNKNNNNNNNHNNNNNNTSLRSIRDNIEQGPNGRNLTHRRSSSTPKRFPNVIPLFPSSSNPSQSKLVILPSLTNANGASPSTLRIVKPPPETIGHSKLPHSIAFNDSPDSPPATIIFSETAPSTSNNDHKFSASTTTAPFRCHLIRPPSSYSIQSSSNASLLVNLNVGGTRFTTTAETFIKKDGKGGKLGEFVGSIIADAKKDSKKKKSGLKDLVMSRKDSMESAYPETSVPSSPPPPSPFSYDQYAENYDDEELDRGTSISLDIAAFDPSNLPDSPTIADPFQVPRPFIPFVKPPSALSIPVTQPLRPFNNLLNINPDDFGEIEDWTPKGTNHFSTYNQENNPFERALGPYFEVMKGQQKVVGAGGKVAAERGSLGVPVDVDSRMEEEEAVRKQAIEGILRGKDASKATRKSYAISKSKNHKSTRISSFMPNFLPPPPLPAEPMEIFLDRPGEIYNAILSYLRDDNLPSELIIPFTTSNVNDPTIFGIDSTTLAIYKLNPSAALSILASLRTLAIEANYLGMKELVVVIEIERQKVVELVRLLEGGADREDRKMKEAAEVKKERSKDKVDKFGWI